MMMKLISFLSTRDLASTTIASMKERSVHSLSLSF